MRSGIVAEFPTVESLENAYEALARAGYTRLTTWTPFPVRKVLKRMPESMVPWIMLAAALIGGGAGYLIQWWCNARSFPINVGGRPLHSAPAFIPITFESAVLASSLVGFFVLLGFCGMPRLHHPVFEIAGFERAMIDRFWIGVDDTDPAYVDQVSEQLAEMGALRCERIARRP
ncbi:MAG TPA: DUF3341 domain-containing protein [Polyangiaceae bacterium]